MLVIRPSKPEDFDELMELAVLSGPGFTSLSIDETLLRARLARSASSFNAVTPPTGGEYLMMLEDSSTGEIAGLCAIKAKVGVDKPFYSFRVLTLSQASYVASKRFDMDALMMVNEFTGYTEVGSLFLKKAYRKGGIGRFLAQTRYMLMATDPLRFSDHVLAELRGVVSDEGKSIFWEHVQRNFFQMDFAEADALSAITDMQFVLDLMPKYPIYLDLLPPEVQKVIGKCHRDGRGARRLLEWEGFKYNQLVDIFDAGPTLTTALQNIRTIRESYLVEVADPVKNRSVHFLQWGIVSANSVKDFRCVRTDLLLQGNSVILPEREQLNLGVKAGDYVRVWIGPPKETS